MPNYQFIFIQQNRKAFWRLLRNGVVVGDGVTQQQARANAASFIRSSRRAA